MPLKGFKKVSEDKNSATLEHPQGHRITVVVSKLNPVEKEALRRLDMCKPEREAKTFAKGGAVKRKMYADSDQEISKDDDAPETKSPVTVNNIVPRESGQAPVPNFPEAGIVANPGVLKNNPSAVPGLQQQVLGEEQKAAAASGIATQTAKDQEARDAQLKQNMQDIQDNAADLKAHADAFRDYTKAHEVPLNSYAQDASTGQKITNAIGMLLAGAGGAGAQAMDFMNKQIDRNVAAQEQNFQHQSTVWHAYEALYHDRNIATNMAKATGADMLANQIAQTANRYGTVQAQSAANTAIGVLNQKAQQEIGLAATRRTGLQKGQLQQNPGPAGMAAMKEKQQQGQPSNQGPDALQDFSKKTSISPEEAEKLDIAAENAPPSVPKGPGAQVSEASQSQGNKNPVIYKILNDDADSTIEGLKQVKYAQPDYEAARGQLTQAQQVEKVLNGPKGDGHGGIHELMQNMYTNIGGKEHGVGGVLGAYGTNLRRGIEKGAVAIPFVGGAAGEAVNAVLPPGEAYREFKTNRAALINDLGAALNGIVAPSEIPHLVEDNLPAFGDSQKDIYKKEQAIVNSIKKALKTTQLSHYGALYEEK